MKLAIIGGGSSYTPELVDGLFARLDAIPVTEVCMMDPNSERLAITAGLAERMSASHGTPFTIHQTDNLDEAVAGSRYVVTQLRVGGIQARIKDEKLGMRHGIIGQETTGVGGFACALRTIPEVLKVARAMERGAPDGFLINFTNPSGIVTEAIVKHSGVRSVGLCNVPIGMVMDVVKHFQCAMEEVKLDYVGLNHLSWVRRYFIGGRDVTSEAMRIFLEHADEEWEEKDIREPMLMAMERLHMFCNYYLQYFYATDAVMAQLRAQERTRGEEIVGIERTLFEKYARDDLHEKPEELSQRGGAHYSTAAFHLISAIENNTGNTQVVCCSNKGAVPGFDDDAVLEIPAEVGEDGARACPQEAPASEIRGLMQCIKAYESLTVEAAVAGDREKAFQAMLMHPLMPGALGCDALLGELLEINRSHLQGTFF